MSLTNSRIIRAKKLADLLDVSRVTIWRWSRENRLPKKRRIGPNVVGWDRDEIEAWLAAKDPDIDQTVRDEEPTESERPNLPVVSNQGGA